MIIRRMLTEAAVRADEGVNLLPQRTPPMTTPIGRARQSRPEYAGSHQSDGFGDTVVVLLRKRVMEVAFDTQSGYLGNLRGEDEARVGRGRMMTKGLEAEREGNQPERSFLPAHPLRLFPTLVVIKTWARLWDADQSFSLETSAVIHPFATVR